MKLKFCANLGFLFCENSNNILRKYECAKAAGFRAVEHPFPAGFSKEEMVNIKNRTNLEVVFINIDLGTVENCQLGVTSFPGMEEKFREHFNNTVDMAKALNCKKIHIMAGKLLAEKTAKHHETYVSNLKYASKVLEKENMIGVIEPINHYSVPGYYLHDFKYAIDVIKEIGGENIKLMVDLFHMQILNGNIINSLKELKPFIGHVQVAQCPDRNEPNTKGELDLKHILNFLEAEIYQDWVGCEYKPKNTSEEGLNWISEFGYSL